MPTSYGMRSEKPVAKLEIMHCYDVSITSLLDDTKWNNTVLANKSVDPFHPGIIFFKSPLSFVH